MKTFIPMESMSTDHIIDQLQALPPRAREKWLDRLHSEHLEIFKRIKPSLAEYGIFTTIGQPPAKKK